MKKTAALISFILAVAVIFTVSTAAAGGIDYNNIKENTVRVHIIANSDSKEDQEIKLLLRNELLNKSGYIFENCKNAAETLAAIDANKEVLEQIANDFLRERGILYNAVISSDIRYFPTKEYDSIILPAGEYNAMCVTLGKGQGKNFWCVLFPQICIGLSKARMSDTLSTGAAALTQKEKSGGIRLKFKTVEIINEFVQKIRKNKGR